MDRRDALKTMVAAVAAPMLPMVPQPEPALELWPWEGEDGYGLVESDYVQCVGPFGVYALIEGGVVRHGSYDADAQCWRFSDTPLTDCGDITLRCVIE